jgi:hypothetical protein
MSQLPTEELCDVYVDVCETAYDAADLLALTTTLVEIAPIMIRTICGRSKCVILMFEAFDCVSGEDC